MDIDYLLTATRSARKSLDLTAPIDRDEIRDCLRIALQAANGSNQQPWRWLVVYDHGLRAKLADLYRDAYLSRTGQRMVSDTLPSDTPLGRLMSSTEWLVEHLADVPALVIPCYEPYLASTGDDDVVPAGDAVRIDLPARLELSACAPHARLRHLPHDPAPSPRAGSAGSARDTRHRTSRAACFRWLDCAPARSFRPRRADPSMRSSRSTVGTDHRCDATRQHHDA